MKFVYFTYIIHVYWSFTRTFRYVYITSLDILKFASECITHNISRNQTIPCTRYFKHATHIS